MADTERRPEQRPEVTPLSLLDRARSNDSAAWRRLMDLYKPLVRFWCGRAGLHGPDAEDVTQETFAAAAAHLGAFHHDRPGDTFRGWLRVIARNQVLAYLRRDQGKVQAEGGSAAWAKLQDVCDPLGGPEGDEQAEMSAVYRRALELVRGEFEARTWQAFWRTTIEDQSPATLAAELAMTPVAIRQAKSRVLRRLRQELGELLD
jgi:RNA polymerase sigma-70 factor (ECF subfamily)